MGSGFYEPLRELLLKYGCTFQRQGKGSHEIWYSPRTQSSFPVAVTIQSRILANKILKAAGIAERL
jgi:hypothetical protein